jgi:hypothetical protein
MSQTTSTYQATVKPRSGINFVTLQFGLGIKRHVVYVSGLVFAKQLPLKSLAQEVSIIDLNTTQHPPRAFRAALASFGN